MTLLGVDWSRRWPNIAGGALLSALLFLGVATLSGQPEWRTLPADSGLLRLSFTHSGARHCRDRTEAELARLPRNMRTMKICDRRRAPVRVEMDVDGKRKLTAELKPSGLAGSGPSRVYRRFELAAGSHRIDLRLNDDPAAAGFTRVAGFDVRLAPGQNVAIDFDQARGGFFIH